MGKYLDHYPCCIGCPVEKYCGTMVDSIRLCNSYNDSCTDSVGSNPEDSELSAEEYMDYNDCWDAVGGDWEG